MSGWETKIGNPEMNRLQAETLTAKTVQSKRPAQSLDTRAFCEFPLASCLKSAGWLSSQVGEISGCAFILARWFQVPLVPGYACVVQ